MILPNLIIAGAPKCGTTSLFEYLASHPEVCPSNVKETYYLMDADYPLYQKDWNFKGNGLAGYEQYFQDCDTEHFSIFVEATPDYMYQRVPLEVLPTFKETPTIIFVLRKPSDRIYSLFRFAKNNLAILDKHLSFAQYLDMVNSKDGGLVGRPILLNAIEHSKYSKYLMQWMKALGSDRIKVFLFEDMVANPAVFMSRLSLMLGIDQKYYDTYPFGRKNETYVIRNTGLHRMMRSYGDKVSIKPIRWLAHKMYKISNMREASDNKSEEDKRVLQELDSIFAPYNDELEKLSALDLARWA